MTFSECRAISDAIAAGGGGIFEMSTDWTSYDDVSYRAADQKLVEAYHEREAGWMVDVSTQGICLCLRLLLCVSDYSVKIDLYLGLF